MSKNINISVDSVNVLIENASKRRPDHSSQLIQKSLFLWMRFIKL